MEGGDEASLQFVVTMPSRGRLSRLRRQAWMFWAVIVATVVVALASVAYAGRGMPIAVPSAVAVGLHPVTKAASGMGNSPQTVTVVQPSHPVEVLDGSEAVSPAKSSTAPHSTPAGDSGDSEQPVGLPPSTAGTTPTVDPPGDAPSPAGGGSGSSPPTTTTVPTTTTTTSGESNDAGSDDPPRKATSAGQSGDK